MAVCERVPADNTVQCSMRSHHCPSTKPAAELAADPVNQPSTDISLLLTEVYRPNKRTCVLPYFTRGLLAITLAAAVGCCFKN